ncbi:MAG: MFS transporter [Hyphomicrobiales bacterium]
MPPSLKSQKRYTLLLLTAIFAVNSLDRQILSILLDPIGREFALSDTQLGLLSGLMFAVVFVLFGFPVAKLAARGNRRNIVSIAAMVWSSLTIVMAGAQNFTQLALARLGVGIGEAGCVAPAHSMISDLYPEERRTSAMSTFVVGANLGILFAFLIGGIAGQYLGWRWAFVIAGVPGLILALLLRFTVQESVRDVSAPQSDRSLFLETFKYIWNDRGLFHAMIGLSIVGIFTFGTLAWNPTFIIRNHQLPLAQLGLFLALTIGVGGALGTWLSGQIADRLGDRDARWRIGIVIIAIIIPKPFGILYLFTETTQLALSFYVAGAVLAGVFWGPTFAYLHSRIPTHMRPMATAIFMFAFNLVGVGIGPTLIGLSSDMMFSDLGPQSLTYALLVVQISGIWAAWHYWQVVQEMK